MARFSSLVPFNRRPPRLRVVRLGPGRAAGPARKPQRGRADAPAGQVTFAATVTLAPTWFRPGRKTPGVITPFLTLYALHDALLKPMPGNAWAPCRPNRGRCRRTASPTSSCSARRAVSQRRSADRRGREVLVRALQGRGATTLKARVRRRGPSIRCACGPDETAVARLHDVLRDAGDQ